MASVAEADWRENQGVMPCRSDDYVEVKYQNGEGDFGTAEQFIWSLDMRRGWKITSWRLQDNTPMPTVSEGVVPAREPETSEVDVLAETVTAREHPGLQLNPKDAIGRTKAPFSCLPAPVLGEVGLALAEGARKYGRHNYRVASIYASVYYDGAMRHLTAWWEGQDIDPDSGLSHVTKAIAGLMVLRDCMMTGKMHDDRPPLIHDPNWQAALNEAMGGLIDKYPTPVAPFTCQSS